MLALPRSRSSSEPKVFGNTDVGHLAAFHRGVIGISADDGGRIFQLSYDASSTEQITFPKTSFRYLNSKCQVLI